MNPPRPICTLLSLASCLTFFVLAIPLARYSISKQLSETVYNSADAEEDAGRIAGFALIAGVLFGGTIGAALGLILLALAHWRGERAHGLSNLSLVINFVALFGGLKLVWPILK